MERVVLYAVYHKDCGHVAGTPKVRWMAERFVAVMASMGQHRWRIRADATDADLEAMLRGDRCVLCQQDLPPALAESDQSQQGEC